MECAKKSKMRKVASYESVLKGSKSLAQEVADALCSRAGALGNSHPSVVIGKEKRLIDNLMHVAEAVRTAGILMTDKSIMERGLLRFDSERSVTKLSNVIETDKSLQSDAVGDCRTPQTEANKMPTEPICATPRGEISSNNNESSSQNVEESWTAVFEMDHAFSVPPEIQREPTSIHMRLALDNEQNDSTYAKRLGGRSNVRSPISSRHAPTRMRKHQTLTNSISPGKRTSRNFLSKKKGETMRNFIAARWMNRSQSENNVPVRHRIRSAINRNSLKAVRKRLRGAFTTSMKRAEGVFNTMKEGLITTFKN